MTVEQEIRALEHCVQQFISSIYALPEELFTELMEGWSPRDVLAHLIGWNRYTIEGCDQMRRGEAPSYLSDWKGDFKHINAASVERYNSEDREELLGELDASFEELKRYLRAFPEAEWLRVPGVTYCGHRITVQNSLNGLEQDYLHHARQIRRWSGQDS
jgi:hypothetical protein